MVSLIKCTEIRGRNAASDANIVKEIFYGKHAEFTGRI